MLASTLIVQQLKVDLGIHYTPAPVVTRPLADWPQRDQVIGTRRYANYAFHNSTLVWLPQIDAEVAKSNVSRAIVNCQNCAAITQEFFHQQSPRLDVQSRIGGHPEGCR
jgi:hypothetical protein